MNKGQFNKALSILVENSKSIAAHLGEVENFDNIIERKEGLKKDNNGNTMIERRTKEINDIKSLVGELESSMNVVTKLTKELV